MHRQPTLSLTKPRPLANHSVLQKVPQDDHVPVAGQAKPNQVFTIRRRNEPPPAISSCELPCKIRQPGYALGPGVISIELVTEVWVPNDDLGLVDPEIPMSPSRHRRRIVGQFGPTETYGRRERRGRWEPTLHGRIIPSLGTVRAPKLRSTPLSLVRTSMIGAFDSNRLSVLVCRRHSSKREVAVTCSL